MVWRLVAMLLQKSRAIQVRVMMAGQRPLVTAEKVSGKKASLTAEALMKEATELALQRQYPEELKAMAMLTTDDAAKKKFADLQKQLASGERSKGVREDLIVVNNTQQYITVHYNGRELGVVPPGHSKRFSHIHDFSGDHFNLDGYGCQGGRWHLHKHGDFNTFTWRCNP